LVEYQRVLLADWLAPKRERLKPYAPVSESQLLFLELVKGATQREIDLLLVDEQPEVDFDVVLLQQFLLAVPLALVLALHHLQFALLRELVLDLGVEDLVQEEH